ncbi:MAG TPA: nucleotidyltransferase family protein [Candidatus Sulfotelmatobacter sp.]|nr:nucleotidyltransferase family protein [Candidatus Sulfotelmatobacter sp.]
MHDRMAEVGAFRKVVLGYYQYHAVPGSGELPGNQQIDCTVTTGGTRTYHTSTSAHPCLHLFVYPVERRSTAEPLVSFAKNVPEDMSPQVNREDRLCLLLCRRQLTLDEQARAREFLSAPLQWPLLLERAYAHGVYPLVYRNLRQLGFSAVPDMVQTELKRAYMANALRNQLLAEDLARLLHLLSHADIPVIPLKGIALAESLYGDQYARVCADVDLLVPPAYCNRAVEVILSAGYPDVYHDAFFRKLELRHGRHYSFQRDNAGRCTYIELHWRLVQYSSRDNDIVADLWAEARLTNRCGAPAYTFSSEWELLYLALHVAEHRWEGLKWLVDLHELCTCRPPDWRRLKEKAEQFELDLVLSQTLAVCSLLLGTRLPDDYNSVSLPAKVRLFPMTPFTAGGFATAFLPMTLLRRRWDKLRYLANIVFIPKPADQDFLNLPAAVSFSTTHCACCASSGSGSSRHLRPHLERRGELRQL